MIGFYAKLIKRIRTEKVINTKTSLFTVIAQTEGKLITQENLLHTLQTEAAKQHYIKI